MANSIMVLYPYKYEGQWVFDDESRGLLREAFVAGTDKILDLATKNIKGATDGFRLIFSAAPFPGYQYELELIGPDEVFHGNWYYSKDFKAKGWLCPSLFKYFDAAPERIYACCQGVEDEQKETVAF